MVLFLVKKNNFDNKEKIANADLKKHSALTTYRTSGKNLPLNVLKAVQAIYAKEQNILRDTFRKEALKICLLYTSDAADEL